MAQYTAYFVSVANGSPIVTGTPGCKFLTNVAAGNAFKVSGDTVIYQVAAVTSDTEFSLSVAYGGATNPAALYQVTRDYTPNLGLAEINVGDQDWPTHLTVETIRKIDSAIAAAATGQIFKGTWNAASNTPAIPAAAPGNANWYYEVAVAGSTSINGISSWLLGDAIVSNGSAWFRVPTAGSAAATSAAAALASEQAAATSAAAALASEQAAAAAETDAAASAASATFKMENAEQAAFMAADFRDVAIAQADLATQKAEEARVLAASIHPPIADPDPGPLYTLPADRSVPWQGNVGVTGDIPAPVQTIYVTLTANGTDDTSALQTALNNCPSGQVVKLNAGTFKLSAALNIPAGKVLRGAGKALTIIQGLSGYSNTTLVNTMGGTLSTSIFDIASGATKGSTTITTTAAHGWSAGDIILIDQLDNANADPPVTKTGSYAVCDWSGRAGLTRSEGQLVKVLTVPNTTSATLEIPLYTSYTRSPQAVKYNGIRTGIGIENLTIDNLTSGATAGALYLQALANSWVSNVEVKGSWLVGIYLRGTYRVTVRDCTIHDPCPADTSKYKGHTYGFHFTYYNSAVLLERNTLYNIGAAVVLSGATSGNVIGYNTIYDLTNAPDEYWNKQSIFFHGAHPSYNLVEGNHAVGRVCADFYWGTTAYNVIYRNKFTQTPAVTGATWDVDLQEKSRYFTFVGNILGAAGAETVYEQENIQLAGLKAVYRLGYTADGDGTAAGNDAAVKTTLLRHGNWDSVSKATLWNGTDAQNLPVSMYLSSKPPWMPSTSSWPVYGPTTLVYAGSDSASVGTDYTAQRLRNIKLMTTTPVAGDFDGNGSLIFVYTA